MKLYEHPFSPNCRKVRAVADELGITLEHVTIDLLRGGSRTPDFLAINPNGKVPVLVDGDFVLWESNAILNYLATKAGKLLPTHARERADVDRWMAWQLQHLAPAISKVSYERIVKKLTGQGTPDAAAIEQGTTEFHRLSAVLEASLGSKEYLAGRLSVADFAVASHYSIAPTAGLEVAKYSKIQSWLDRMLARDSMKRALAAAQAAMQ